MSIVCEEYVQENLTLNVNLFIWPFLAKVKLKGCQMGRSDKVSLWYVSLVINTRIRFFILE